MRSSDPMGAVAPKEIKKIIFRTCLYLFSDLKSNCRKA
jgi:hypothetical protein